MKQNKEAKNIILKCGNDFMFPITLVLGFYIILHGHLTPGGGFQGGVIVAAGVALVFLAYGSKGLKKVFPFPNALKLTENVGSLMYTFFALLGIIMGANFCRNAIFNIGNPGDLYSSGTIFWMNFSVGLKVMMGVGFMLIVMLATLNRPAENEKRGD
jgi:multicomponent Na+:H+ antiporter subunit B